MTISLSEKKNPLLTTEYWLNLVPAYAVTGRESFPRKSYIFDGGWCAGGRDDLSRNPLRIVPFSTIGVYSPLLSIVVMRMSSGSIGQQRILQKLSDIGIIIVFKVFPAFVSFLNVLFIISGLRLLSTS